MTYYEIEGERLRKCEIERRLPHVKPCTIRKRLDYGWRTWEALSSGADHRKRTYPVRPASAFQPKPYKPANNSFNHASCRTKQEWREWLETMRLACPE